MKKKQQEVIRERLQKRDERLRKTGITLATFATEEGGKGGGGRRGSVAITVLGD